MHQDVSRVLVACAVCGLVFRFRPPWRHLWWGLCRRERAQAPTLKEAHKEQVGLAARRIGARVIFLFFYFVIIFSFIFCFLLFFVFFVR